MAVTVFSRFLKAFVGLVFLAPTAFAQRSQDALSRFIAAIPDSQVRRFWQQAAQSSSLAGIVAQLLTNDKPVTVRRTPQAAFAPQQLRRPRIAQSVLADVRPFSSNPIVEYSGRYVVTNADGGHLTGMLDRIVTPFELFYKLPDNHQLPNVGPGSQLQLRLTDESYDMSRHRRVYLASGSGAPLLLYVSDGSDTPYRLTITDPPVRITQQQGGGGRGGAGGGGRGGGGRGGGGPYTVVFAIDSQSTNGLSTGQRAVITWRGRPFEVVVLESVGISGAAPEMEGDRYHVTVLLYALP